MKKLFTLLLTLLFLVGCGSGGGNSTPTADPNGGGNETAAKVVTIQAPTPLISMDSAIATDGTSFSAMTMCTAGLMSLDADGNAVEDMAESVEMTSDGLTYTFHIRDAKWSNGDPVTAYDFEYAWNRVLDPDTASDYAWILETANIESFEATDEKTFVVKLLAPSGFFLGLTAFPTFFPLNQKFVEEKGDQFSLSINDLLYNGPYKMTSWTPGYSFEFELNEDYWDAANFAAKYAPKVVFREITDTQTALMEYEQGNLDTVALSGEQVTANEGVEGFINKLTGYMYYLTINMGNNVHNRAGAADLANANIRQAILYALNREEIARVLNDGSVAAGGIVPVGLASNPETGKDFRDDNGIVTAYDPDKAAEFYKKGVEELGHEVVIELLYGTDEGDSIIKAAEQVQSFLEDAGFTVNLNGKPKKERLDLAGNANDHDYDVMLTRWGPDYGDPQTYMDLFVSTNTSNNDGGYKSEKYDGLVFDAERGEGMNDPAKRWADFLEAEKVLVVEDAAIIPVFQAGGAMIINPNISGIEFHSASVDSYRHIVVK
ncbi:MAG: peptide ABC transporter substrate-binding protein [Erysipelotrichaceae bacterium]|nr:peptide ABC transporter substrate-binding protein [Erysipelotrichaceae bacterium]MBQ1512181.1 peptide ABC transporter substrate-binding protein [Erysipelotrichaceae bacterium]MBQ1810053.1 peptide ABC transporter substrate-binding protein [Erysipelotrichaceae bacterium]